ncbi:hypothetical protein U1Q18_037225 [Sarracenia purpurea var. burkii]
MADNGVETRGKMEEASSYGGADAAGAETGWRFKPEGGSLIPPEKKLVKTMMVEKLRSTLCNKKGKRKISPRECGSA